MFIVVAYDVSDDKRRARLHKTLRRYGEPVQYSVFECVLTEGLYQQMLRAVEEVVEAGDNIRYYDICSACRKEIVTLGQAVTTRDQREYVI
jgi:CRISPR-associated protein Cas2